MLGCPEGIHFETAPQECVMLGYPEGILSFIQINFLFFYYDSENPCFYSNNQNYKAGESEIDSCRRRTNERKERRGQTTAYA